MPGPSGGLAMTFAGKMGRSIGTLRLRASHEVVHHYLHRFARRPIPRWFDEGCAVLFENGHRLGAVYVLPVQEARIRVIEGSYRQSGRMLTPIAAHLSGGAAFDGRHYGEAYAMLRVLVMAGSPPQAPALTAAWQALISEPKEGDLTDPFTAALLGSIAGGAASWEESVVRWVRAGDRRERVRIPLPAGR